MELHRRREESTGTLTAATTDSGIIKVGITITVRIRRLFKLEFGLLLFLVEVRNRLLEDVQQIRFL